MNPQQIKTAVDQGKTVHWSNDSYTVIKDELDQYLIVYGNGENCVGLTNLAGKLNGREDQFYVEY